MTRSDQASETPRAEPAAEASADTFRTDRTYLGADHQRNERRTWIVAGVCTLTLVTQVTGGVLFHSIALAAQGVHMAAHIAALVVAAGAYGLARRFAQDPRFAFGTGKTGYLAGFANAVVLAMTATLIAVESVQRLVTPQTVDYRSALWLAGGGLIVTLICVWLLKPTERNDDLNLSAAHLHLTADAWVGGLTIAGLAAGWTFGWTWADPLMGLVGAFLVAQFGVSLIRRTAAALLDMNPSAEMTAEVRSRLEAQGERVVDLHLWRLGPGHQAAVVVLEAEHPQDPKIYHRRLAGLAGLSHVTVEVRGRIGASHSHAS